MFQPGNRQINPLRPHRRSPLGFSGERL